MSSNLHDKFQFFLIGFAKMLAPLSLSNSILWLFPSEVGQEFILGEARFCALWLCVMVMGGGILNPFCQFLVRMEFRMDFAICETHNTPNVMPL